ncbi:MAG TPA: sulfurtransferase FdhD, partial [Bacteroidetes bacterium]|nr:sulfurtransferase FdhD [Bacteroidota bacterium]
CQIIGGGNIIWPASLIHKLPALALQAQQTFRYTGGIHAASLFDQTGKMLLTREDIGRHNAVDKIVGSMLLADMLPGTTNLLLVSGRAGFELVQKTIIAGIPVMAAIGAPSSLAVELAATYQLSLLGFVRNERFNIYTGTNRIKLD